MADATLLQKSVGYTLTARWLHWLTAVLVLFQIPAGLLIANFEIRKFPRSNALALAAFIGRFMRYWSYRP